MYLLSSAAACLGFLPGWEEKMDQIFQELLTNETVPLPGFVAKVKRGEHVYHKAFGHVRL